MKIKSNIGKTIFLFTLLTTTCFAAGKNVNVEFKKIIVMPNTQAL